MSAYVDSGDCELTTLSSKYLSWEKFQGNFPSLSSVGEQFRRYICSPSMPRLTHLRVYSNEIAVKGKDKYKEELVKDWAKPEGLPARNKPAGAAEL